MNLRGRLKRAEEVTRQQQAPTTTPDGVVVDIEAWQLASTVYRHFSEDIPCGLTPSEMVAALNGIGEVWCHQHIHQKTLDRAGLKIDVLPVQHLRDAVNRLLYDWNTLHAQWCVQNDKPLPADLQARFERWIRPPHECRRDGQSYIVDDDTLSAAVEREAVYAQKHFDVAWEQHEAYCKRYRDGDKSPPHFGVMALGLVMDLLEETAAP